MALDEELPKVLVLHPPFVFNHYQNLFCRRFHFLRAWESPLPIDHFLSTHAHSIHVLLCNPHTSVNAALLRLLPSLRLVVTSSVGLDHIHLSECRRRGIAVANIANIYSDDVADLAVGLLIDVLRKITVGDRFVRAGRWPSQGSFPLGSKLRGKRVGIVGLGKIGLEVAKRLEPFGCILSYNSRMKKPSISFPYYADLFELAANCDALVICCALTDQTYHMIDKEVLLALGKEGIIVNIARGAIIDEKELVRCLVQGEIAGAGLDVFAYEPNVPNDLLKLDNVVLSPHRSVFTEESFWGTYELISGNLEAFFSNKPLLTPVVLDE